MMDKTISFLIAMLFFASCKKEQVLLYLDEVKTIQINEHIRIDNGFSIHNPIFNYVTYNNFLKHLASSDHFIIVKQKDFESTNSNDKVVLSIRHDIDDNINAAVKFAYLEHKYGIKATYFFLHTANYYGTTKFNYFKRNENIIHYIKKIQDAFGHEAGWHNDLVTLQIVYGLNPKEYLATELKWLRDNGITIVGTVAHGSPYCCTYHYVNTYFWEDVPDYHDSKFYNYEYVKKDSKTIKIEKDKLSNYGFEYESSFLNTNYYFSDHQLPDGKQWHTGMVNLDTIKPGKKVIIMLHPQHFD